MLLYCYTPTFPALFSVLSKGGLFCQGDSQRERPRVSEGATFSRPWGREPVSRLGTVQSGAAGEVERRPRSLLMEQRVSM